MLKTTQRLPPSDYSLEKCQELTAKLDDLHRKEESYWYLRSYMNELRDGDQNTGYFHYKAESRRRRNTIKGLEDEGGVWHCSELTLKGW